MGGEEVMGNALKNEQLIGILIESCKEDIKEPLKEDEVEEILKEKELILSQCILGVS